MRSGWRADGRSRAEGCDTLGAMPRYLILLLLALLPAAAEVRVWSAKWVSVAGASPVDYGVYHFRKTFELPARPDSFVVHVTADNRYVLYVNGERVSWGPAYGDLMHWRYETVDIAPYLKSGRNSLAAVVWNYGQLAGLTQITDTTGFLLQGDTKAEEIVNTGKGWRGVADPAYAALPVDRKSIRWQYYVAPPGEQFDASLHPWGWQQRAFDDTAWKEVLVGEPGCALYWTKSEVQGDCHDRRTLVPRPIPMMDYVRQRFSQFQPIVVPPNTHKIILLDQERVTTAYPELRISGGRGSKVALTYAESLWVPDTLIKGNRNETAGKQMRGLRDVVLPDGRSNLLWSPLWWRAFRYVQIDIQTGDEPLSLADASSFFTAYPFTRKARFEGGEPWLAQTLDIGWWTNRLSSNEIFQDAYYEQMQYAGDTRIEALVAIYESGDARLVRNAIQQFDSTRTPDGLTYSRAPSRLYQYTPTFSLIWIGMVHDYWRYVNDPEFVRSMQPGVRAVLGWFQRLQQPDGRLTRLPWYNFLDSNVPWKADALGHYELQLLQGFLWAADLEGAFGTPEQAAAYRRSADVLRATIEKIYWDPTKQSYASDAEHTFFTQHANALAVLTGVSGGEKARSLMEHTLSDSTLIPTTIYFSYYLHEAVVKAGLGDRYLDLLGRWRQMAAQGVTAWPEVDAPEARSDCHGWGDHPNIEVFRTVLGVDSAAPGWERIMVTPHLGRLPSASGTIPHPRGEITVRYLRSGDGLDVTIDTPVPGDFEWNGKRAELKAGSNSLKF
jgi:alpha-L-rhamnosidase